MMPSFCLVSVLCSTGAPPAGAEGGAADGGYGSAGVLSKTLLLCFSVRGAGGNIAYTCPAFYGFIILHIVELFWILLTIRTALCASCSWFFLSICELFLFTSTAWGRVKCCCQAWGAPSISACSSAARCCAWTPAALPHTSTLCCCLWSVPSTIGSLSYMSLFC